MKSIYATNRALRFYDIDIVYLSILEFIRCNLAVPRWLLGQVYNVRLFVLLKTNENRRHGIELPYDLIFALCGCFVKEILTIHVKLGRFN